MKKVKLSEIKKMVIKTIKESYITERRASSYTIDPEEHSEIEITSVVDEEGNDISDSLTRGEYDAITEQIDRRHDYESDRYSLDENQEDEPESALRENKNTKNMNIRKLIRKTLEENYIQIQKQKHIDNIVDFINDDDYSNLRDKLIGLGDEDFVEWVEQKDWPIHFCATVEICKRARISKFKDRLADLSTHIGI